MSRSAFEIASTAVGDLLAVQTSFDNSKAILELIMKAVPSSSNIHALAELGMMDIAQWEAKVLDWAIMMDEELDAPSLETEYEAMSIKWKRLDTIRCGNPTADRRAAQ